MSTGTRTPIALNESVVVEFDGALDPLRLTPRSVRVQAPDGRVLAARCGVQAGRLVVELVVDGELLAQAPGRIELTLAGLPSRHALAMLDGRWLAGTTRLAVDVASARLAPVGGTGARLVSVAGHDVPPPSPLRPSDSMTLVFDGVLDPATLVDGSCPLFPVEQGLVLGEPVAPGVRWRCTGRRFEVELDLSELKGRFELDLRQFRGRDLSGAAPQPTLRTELALS